MSAPHLRKTLAPADRARIEAVIFRHRDRLARARGFLAASPGFPIVGGELLREPAIIVYVLEKLNASRLDDEADESVPRTLDGVRVDVNVADPRTQLELLASAAPAAPDGPAARGGPPAGRAGRNGRNGPAAVVAAAAARARAAAVTPTYVGLRGNPIDKTFIIEKPLLCHVGPDCGWFPLRDFLAETKRELTVAMFDFNAGYISAALAREGRARQFPIKLALDHDVRNAKTAKTERDTVDEEDVQKRLKRLGKRYSAQLIVCHSSGQFASAYHEKVAVRDRTTTWLSSGNWTPASQPERDPLTDPAAARGMYSAHNREWHIIVDDKPLAGVFEDYIEHDRTMARQEAARGIRAVVAPLPDLFVPIEALAHDFARAAAAPAPQPVAPVLLPSAPRRVKVQPVLSPDNYAARVTELIKSARRRLYLQFSYIYWSDDEKDKPFTEMLKLLGRRSWRKRETFDLRIIIHRRDAARVRELTHHGFNEKVFRKQTNIHNKGIVADGKRVMISSQNWSGDGFLRNRDAGLILHDPDIADYYERVFLDDWDKRAEAVFSGRDLPVRIAAPRQPTPRGMVRMAWRDYYGE